MDHPFPSPVEAPSVNFPHVDQSRVPDHTRFLHVHRNAPGVLGRINAVFSTRGLNVAAQFLQTEGDLGYVVVDAEHCRAERADILAALCAIDGTIRVRAMTA